MAATQSWEASQWLSSPILLPVPLCLTMPHDSMIHHHLHLWMDDTEAVKQGKMQIIHLYVCSFSETPARSLNRSCWSCKQFTFCWIKGSKTIRGSAQLVSFVLFFVFFLFLVWLFEAQVSLCSLGSPGTCDANQAGLKFTEIFLSLLPKCWDKSHAPLCPLVHTCNPVTKRQNEQIFWGLITSQFRLLAEF